MAAVKFKGVIGAFCSLTALPLNTVKLHLLRYASNCLEEAVGSNLSLSAGPQDAGGIFPRLYGGLSFGSQAVQTRPGSPAVRGQPMARVQQELSCVCQANEREG